MLQLESSVMKAIGLLGLMARTWSAAANSDGESQFASNSCRGYSTLCSEAASALSRDFQTAKESTRKRLTKPQKNHAAFQNN